MPKRRRSVVWDHFVDIDGSKSKCNHCNALISFTSGCIGNLSRHLRRRHIGISLLPAECQKVPAPTPNDASPTSSEETEVMPKEKRSVSVPKLQKPFNFPSLQRKRYMFSDRKRPFFKQKKTIIDDQLIIMIAKEYHPLGLVEEPEFGKFVALLCPSYRLPTRKMLSENLISRFCLKLEKEIHLKLEKISAICLTADSWTSIDNVGFIAVTAHYIDAKNTKLCSTLLGCIEFEEHHTSENLCRFIKELITKWKIENKVEAIVSDNSSNVLEAVQLGNWNSIGCFTHSLNLTVEASLEQIKEHVQKVKKIVEFFERSAEGMLKLKEIQEQMDLPVLKLKQDDPTRWNTTLDMLDRILTVKDAVIASLAIVKNELSLNEEDWLVLEKVVPILQIFNDVSVEISSEKNVTLSKVIVFCRILKKQITQYLNDWDTLSLRVEVQPPGCIRKLLLTLDGQCQNQFSNLETNFLYAESTILDPRFKNKGFRDQQNFKMALNSLKHKVTTLFQTTQPTRSTSPFIVKEEFPSSSSATATQEKRNSFWDMFDSEMESLVPQNTTSAGTLELNQYLNEPLLNRSGDPLLWWDARKNVYPILFSYMLKRLNLVATWEPCKRIFSKAGLFESDRCLSAKQISQLFFINSNSN